MLKTICIKSNNLQVNNYLIENIKKFKNTNISLSVHEFSVYTNIILHYKGSEIKEYNILIKKISSLLANTVIKFYNNYLLKNKLNTNYFYFNDFEKTKILEYCNENCNEINFNKKRRKLIANLFKEYFSCNKKVILDGFITFYLYDYFKLLDEIIDQSINNYLIEKEYHEFIDLLKIYISTEPPKTDIIHLIYKNDSAILLNKKGEKINIDTNLKTKFLSDINFSENDYCLNTLLNLLPKELIIYNDNKKDEFLNTLEQIFENRIRLGTLEQPGTGYFYQK